MQTIDTRHGGWSGWRLYNGAVFLLAGIFLCPSISEANEPEPGQSNFSVSASPIYQTEADIEGGGDFSVRSALLRIDSTHEFSKKTRAGLTMKYALQDYEFESASGLGGTPWNKVSRFGISVPFHIRLERQWLLGITPSVDWLREEGAPADESESYGLTVFGLRNFAARKRLGLGAGIFRKLDGGTKVVPLLAVDWRFNEHWRLANPFDAEILGRAGLELSYRFDNGWRLGGGGVYRSTRFRLDDRGVAPGGVGENSAVAGYLRLRRATSAGLVLEVYAGAMYEGELEVQNSEGAVIAKRDYDTAPFVALTLTAGF